MLWGISPPIGSQAMVLQGGTLSMTVNELVASFGNLAEDAKVTLYRHFCDFRELTILQAIDCLEEVEEFAFYEGEPETDVHPYFRDELFIIVK